MTLAAGYSSEPGRPLSPRQRDALRCAAHGKSVKQSAAELGVSESTVRSLRSTARDRLGERSTIGAVLTAMERGEL